MYLDISGLKWPLEAVEKHYQKIKELNGIRRPFFAEACLIFFITVFILGLHMLVDYKFGTLPGVEAVFTAITTGFIGVFLINTCKMRFSFWTWIGSLVIMWIGIRFTLPAEILTSFIAIFILAMMVLLIGTFSENKFLYLRHLLIQLFALGIIGKIVLYFF